MKKFLQISMILFFISIVSISCRASKGSAINEISLTDTFSEPIIIANNSEKNGFYKLYLQNNDLVPITGGDYRYIFGIPDWSETTKRLAFQCSLTDKETLGICLMDQNGENFEYILTNLEPGVNLQPYNKVVWSQDGKSLIFSMASKKPYYLELYTIDIESREVKLLTSIKSEWENPHFSSGDLSPDGKVLVLEESSSRLMTLNMLTFEVSDIAKGTRPSWAPNGEKIVFIEDGDIKVISPNGENEKTLLESFIGPEHVCVSSIGVIWSVDNDYLFFLEICGENDPFDLYLLDVGTGEIRKILSHLKTSPYFMISPLSN